jgi:hypothetical protein
LSFCRDIAVDKVTVRGFSELHVIDALIRQLLIFILKYLSGILLSVDDVLQIGLRCLQLIYPGLEICKSTGVHVRLLPGYSQ